MVTITGQKCPFHHFPLFQTPDPGANPTLGPARHERPPKQRSTHKSRLIHGIHPKKKHFHGWDTRSKCHLPSPFIPPAPLIPNSPHGASPWLQPFLVAADPRKRNKEVEKQETHPKGRFPAPAFPVLAGWEAAPGFICPRAQGGGAGL